MAQPQEGKGGRDMLVGDYDGIDVTQGRTWQGSELMHTAY